MSDSNDQTNGVIHDSESQTVVITVDASRDDSVPQNLSESLYQQSYHAPNGSEDRPNNLTIHNIRRTRTLPTIKHKTTMSSSEGQMPSEKIRTRFRNGVWHVMKKNRIRRSQNIFARLPRGAPQRLCSECVKLELTAEKFVVQHHDLRSGDLADLSQPINNTHDSARYSIISGATQFKLGTFSDLKMKGEMCPLCRLVLSSVRDANSKAMIFATGSTEEAVKELDNENATCYASWQIDGRVIVCDSNNEPTSRAQTRRIRIQWNGGGLQDSFLILVPPPAFATGGLFLGRNVGQARDNFDRIRTWVDLCIECHSATCTQKPTEGYKRMITSAYFGVIDVKKMSLTSLPEGERYVALSYTWGEKFDARHYETTCDNVMRRCEPDGLKAVANLFPQTIKDAIVLVKHLGLRYLWVDALCITQEPAFSRSWLLNSKIMDNVYGNAHFTICAADGDDANAGLMGISGKRMVEQQMEDYAPGVRLMAAHVGETYIEESTWSSRAWTFQERLLSRRCLIFTKGRIYFQCRATTRSEDVMSEDKSAGWSLDLLSAPLQGMKDLDIRPLQVYMKCVSLYTQRSLTRPRDILAAFRGLGNILGRALGGRLVYCLPDTHFDLALLWEPRDSPSIRGDGSFPSWSWCGWDRTTMEYRAATIGGCLLNLQEWLTEHTWIVWYIRDEQGMLQLIWDRNRAVATNESIQRRWRGYPSNEVPAYEQTYDPYGRVARKEHAGLTTDKFKLTLPEYPYRTAVVTAPFKCAEEAEPGRPYLQFWTWSAHFRIDRRYRSISKTSTPQPRRNLDRVSICDRKGDWCGTIVLDHNWLRQHERDHGNNRTYEFIAISDARDFDEKEEYDSWTYYVPCHREQSEWDLYFVLLIEKHGNLSKRIGLGKVFKQAFFHSFSPGRDWREFILG